MQCLGVPAPIGALLFAVPFCHAVANGALSPSLVSSGSGLHGYFSWRPQFEGNQAKWSPLIDAATSAPIPASITAGLTGDQVQGAKLFSQKGCTTCHAVGGSGGLKGPDLSYVANRLNQAQLITRVLNGGPNMPAFGGNLTDSDTKALVDFLQTLKSPSQLPATTSS